MTNWNTTRLGDFITHKKGFAFKSKDYCKSGTPIIRVSDLTENSIDLSQCHFINQDLAKPYYDYELLKNDLIITTVGSWQYNPQSVVGKVVKVPQQAAGGLLNQNAVRLRAKKSEDQLFLYYRLKLADFSDYLITGAQGSANQAAITLDQIFNFTFNLPTPNVRHRVAEILSALDDKIELNRRMNQTLEQIAQTLFRQYFVDGIDEENLPEGWREGVLEDVIDIKHGYAFKGEFFSDDPTENILVTPGNFRIGGGFNNKKYKFYKGVIPEDYILAKDDLIVTMTDLSKDGDTLGYSALVPIIPGKLLLHNQRIGKVIYKSELPLKFYLHWLLRSDSYRATVLGSASGSTVKHTSPSRILEYKCIIPNAEALLTFEEQVKELYEKEHANMLEIYTLSTLRDTLLPKLMSGEIDVMQPILSEQHEPVLS